VTGGASEVDETTFGEENDVTSVFHEVSVNLWLDVEHFSVGLQPGGVDFAIEVTDVADDGVVLHLFEVSWGDDVLATGGGDKDVAFGTGEFHGGDFVSFHGGLEGVDRVNFSDQDTGTESTEGLGGSLTDVTVSGNNAAFTGNHDIGGTLDTVEETFTATVQVIELGFGDGVVDIDSWDLQHVLGEHLVQVVDTGGGFFGDTLDSGEELWVFFVDHVGEVTSVVEDHVEWLTVWENNGLINAPFVFFVGFSFPGVDWDTGGGHGGGGFVLGGEDVA